MKNEMKKVAKTAVKGHESRMHKGTKKMAMGGMASAPGMTMGGAGMVDPRMAMGGAGMVDPRMAMGGAGMGGQPMYAKGGGVEHKGKTKGKTVRMAKGGSVSKRADGCATKGKTKGTMVKMAKGGRTC
jgi:hypothetical protein